MIQQARASARHWDRCTADQRSAVGTHLLGPPTVGKVDLDQQKGQLVHDAGAYVRLTVGAHLLGPPTVEKVDQDQQKGPLALDARADIRLTSDRP